jgi:hypothetical protein
MEQQLTDILRSIPAAPRSAQQVFEAERMEQLPQDGSTPHPPDVTYHLLMEFQRLSQPDRSALQQRAAAAHRSNVSNAYDLLRKVRTLSMMAKSALTI